METDKPKRKRKPGEGRSLRWLAAAAVLLVITGMAGGFLYWRGQPSIMPDMPMTLPPTPVPFELPGQCDITKTYDIVIERSGTGYEYRVLTSPKNTYQVNYLAEGIFLETIASMNAPVKLLPAFGDMYAHQVEWSANEQSVAYLNGTKLLVANGDGTAAQLLADPVIGFRGWSPDGSHLIYDDGQQMWLSTRDGSEKRPITEPPVANTYYSIYQWSDNSRYIVLGKSDINLNTISIIPVDAAQPVVVQEVPELYSNQIYWSPDRNNVAFFAAKNSQGQTALTLVALDGSSRYDALLPAETLLEYLPVVWSPDSQKIALLMSAPTGTGTRHATFSIYGLDGTSLPLVGKNLLDFYYTLRSNSAFVPEAAVLQWSPDSRTFYFWEAEGDQASFNALDTTTGAISQLFRNPVASVYYASGTRSLLTYASLPDRVYFYQLDREGSWLNLTPFALEYAQEPVWADDSRNAVAIKGRRGIFQAISVVNIQRGTSAELLPDNAIDAGNPNWSPQNTWVAATYATIDAPDAVRRVSLVWMNMVDQTTRTLDDDFLSVYNLAWSADERYLAYTAWRSSGTSLEVVDTLTGEHTTLLAKAHVIEPVTYDAARQRFAAVWRMAGSALYYQEFAPDGTAYPAMSLAPKTRSWKIFWSPAGASVAVKASFHDRDRYIYDDGTTRTFAVRYEALLMATEEGESRILANRLNGLGDPSWSPDGKLMAFTQFTKDRQLSVHITDASGNELWQSPLDRLYTLAWQACTAE